MYTRCPQCKAVHRLIAAELAHAKGLVQCGDCGRTFSALSFLFDEWPSGQPTKPAKGPDVRPPVIGRTQRPRYDADNLIPDDTDTDKKTRHPHQVAWSLVAMLLVLVTIANLAWTFRDPLMEIPEINTWLEQNGWLEVEEEGLLSDPGNIQLVSRDMHTHPTRTGILVLSLTFVNLAERPQVFPVLEITLLDATNQAIAQRRFQPLEYLRAGADTVSGLATDVFLPVLLELGDPGEQAVGFEIEFH